MKQSVLTFVVIAALALLAPIVTAQTPYLQAYFEPALTTTNGDCPFAPAGTVLDTLYVVAHDFGAQLSSLEFSISFPPQLTWMTDITDPTASVTGQSPLGINISWPTPLDATGPAVVMRVQVVWMCDICLCPGTGGVLCFDVHPGSGFLRASTWPDQNVITGDSGTSIICTMCGEWRTCATLPSPVERATWGHVKAMYE